MSSLNGQVEEAKVMGDEVKLIHVWRIRSSKIRAVELLLTMHGYPFVVLDGSIFTEWRPKIKELVNTAFPAATLTYRLVDAATIEEAAMNKGTWYNS